MRRTIVRTRRTIIRCSKGKGHIFSAKHPIGNEDNVDDCPYCLIDGIKKDLTTLRKWIKQIED